MVFLLATVLGLAADLGSKAIAFERIADRPVKISKAQVLSQMEVDPRTLGMLIPAHEPVVAVPSVLEFKLVLNPGAVFGSGAGKRWFFIGFTVVAMGFATMLFALWTRSRDTLSHVAIGLIVSGGIGNLYDRMTYACVRDFIHPLPGVHYPFGWSVMGSREIWPYVSNVADAALLIGIAYLTVRLWREDSGRAKGDAEGAAAKPLVDPAEE